MNPRCGSHHTEAEAKDLSGQRTQAEATVGVKLFLTARLRDEDLIARDEPQIGGRSGRQLQHAVRAPHDPYHPPPCGQLRKDLLDALLAVEEHCVTRGPHEQQVDPSVHGVDPHTLSWLQRAAKHEPDATRDETARHLEVLRQGPATPHMYRPHWRALG